MWEGLFTTSEVLCYYAGFISKKKRVTLCCSVAIGPQGKDCTWPLVSFYQCSRSLAS